MVDEGLVLVVVGHRDVQGTGRLGEVLGDLAAVPVDLGSQFADSCPHVVAFLVGLDGKEIRKSNFLNVRTLNVSATLL